MRWRHASRSHGTMPYAWSGAGSPARAARARRGTANSQSLAARTDWHVWSWDGNWDGALGIGGTQWQPQILPAQVVGLLGQTTIAANTNHALSAAGVAPSRQTSTTYACDRLYRLSGATMPSGTISCSYDPVGNQLSKVLGGATSQPTRRKVSSQFDTPAASTAIDTSLAAGGPGSAPSSGRDRVVGTGGYLRSAPPLLSHMPRCVAVQDDA